MLCSNYARELREVPKVGQFAQMLQMMCFGQEQPLATWMGLSFPLLFILDAYIVQERAWCVTLIFHTAETQSILYQLLQRQKILQTWNFSWNSPSVGLLHPSSAEPEHRQGPERQSLWQLFNCVKHSCMSERTLGLTFTRNLFRTVFSGIK